jgi:C_GCAxxG_C_C family probable redox protein
LFAGLEAQGKSSPDAIAAVSGLAGGVGFSGELCGGLTGGACLLGLYAGRGHETQKSDERLNIMVSELMDWFHNKYGAEFGGIRCREITEDDPKMQPLRCPRIVGGVLNKVKALLQENGFEWERNSSVIEPSGETVNLGTVSGTSLAQSSCPCAAGATET